MDHHEIDPPRPLLFGGQLHALSRIAIAEGILAERYHVSMGVAIALLESHALATGLPTLEAAN